MLASLVDSLLSVMNSTVTFLAYVTQTWFGLAAVVTVTLVGLKSLYDSRYGGVRRSRNFLDRILDDLFLNLNEKTNREYRDYMEKMLIKNAHYNFPTVSSYRDFQHHLYLSLGGDPKCKADYLVFVDFVVGASNRFYWSCFKLLPRFIVCFARMKCNGHTTIENNMHLLTLHATSIGAYLSASLKTDFLETLKRVRVVRDTTGFKEGKRVRFARVRQPFMGTKPCPLSGKHARLRFPPLADDHDFLTLIDYGNALGVGGTNDREHLLEGRPLREYPFMTDDEYWTRKFPQEVEPLE